MKKTSTFLTTFLLILSFVSCQNSGQKTQKKNIQDLISEESAHSLVIGKWIFIQLDGEEISLEEKNGINIYLSKNFDYILNAEGEIFKGKYTFSFNPDSEDKNIKIALDSGMIFQIHSYDGGVAKGVVDVLDKKILFKIRKVYESSLQEK